MEKNDLKLVIQINKDFESKINILEEENINLRKKLENAKENFEEHLKNQVSYSSKEIKYKNHKIKYYQNLFESLKGISTYNFLKERTN